MEDPQVTEFLSAVEVAKRLDVHEKTVRRWARWDLVRYLKVGNTLRVEWPIRKSHPVRDLLAEDHEDGK